MIVESAEAAPGSFLEAGMVLVHYWDVAGTSGLAKWMSVTGRVLREDAARIAELEGEVESCGGRLHGAGHSATPPAQSRPSGCTGRTTAPTVPGKCTLGSVGQGTQSPYAPSNDSCELSNCTV